MRLRNVCVQAPVQLTNAANGNGVCGTSVILSIPVPVLAAFYVSKQTENLANGVCPGTHGDARDSFASSSKPVVLRRQPGWRDDQAAQLVEFAVSLPLLVLFVVGIFDFSNAFTLKQKLTNVARDAARAAAAEPSSDLQSALPRCRSWMHFKTSTTTYWPITSATAASP